MPEQPNAYPNNLREELEATMAELVGRRVRVAIVPDGVTRNTFGPQMAVAGTLETRSGENGLPHYRVLCDDDNFAYFTLRNIVLANTLASVPTITLDIPVYTEEATT
jgi:hypothetical protein